MAVNRVALTTPPSTFRLSMPARTIPRRSPLSPPRAYTGCYFGIIVGHKPAVSHAFRFSPRGDTRRQYRATRYLKAFERELAAMLCRRRRFRQDFTTISHFIRCRCTSSPLFRPATRRRCSGATARRRARGWSTITAFRFTTVWASHA